VADDHLGIRRLLSTIMEEIGYEVRLAENGLEAVEAVKERHPHLAFLDVCMPAMNGLQALGRIKEISPETTVVIMTAYISNQVVSEAMEKGASFCISKPFDINKTRPFLQKYFEEEEYGNYYPLNTCSLTLLG